MARKILVLGETKENELRNVSFEAIAAAHKAADGGEVVGVLFGEGAASHAEAMIQYGADRVIVSEMDELKQYTTDAYMQAMEQVCEEEQAEGLVIGHTSSGKDLAPRLSRKLSSGLITDCVEIEGEGTNAQFIRPVYSGKAFEKIKMEDGFLFITIRPNNIPALEADSSRSGNIDTKTFTISNLRTIIKEVVKKSTGGIDLAEANIIVAGGRGVKSAEGFKPLEELAGVLAQPLGRHAVPAMLTTATMRCRSDRRVK